MAFQSILVMESNSESLFGHRIFPTLRSRRYSRKEDVTFFWSVLSCDWQKESGALLALVMNRMTQQSINYRCMHDNRQKSL